MAAPPACGCDDEDAVDPWEHADEDKLAELLLYVAVALGDDPTAGTTKLNKVLYFAEFSHIRSHGAPITGAAYQKLPQGPAPRRLLPVRSGLIEAGAARLKKTDYLGYTQHRLVPLRSPDMSAFSDSELRAVGQAIDALRGKSAAAVSELSHRDMAWRMVEEGEDIPFSSAFVAPKSFVTDRSRKHAEQIADKAGLPR
jgi:hypothetical protein